MAGLTIRIDVRLSPALLRWGLAAVLLSGLGKDISSESVKLTTYYPSPSGIYRRLITTQSAFLARDGTPGANQTWLDVGTTASGAAAAGNYKMAVIGGNVGIGTTSPGAALEVVGGASGGTPAITVSDTAAGYATIASAQSGFEFVDAAVGNLKPINAGGMSITGAAPFVTPPVNGLYVQGSVGIGISAPGAPLDVEGAGGVILNAGNVGIGKTSPGAVLDVNGPITVRGCNNIGALTPYGPGVQSCPPNTYATWSSGIMALYQYDTIAPVIPGLLTGWQIGDGEMLCCSCAGFTGGVCPGL